MEPDYSSTMDELEELQQALMQRIEEVQRAGARQFRRELQTGKAALKSLNELIEEMKQQRTG